MTQANPSQTDASKWYSIRQKTPLAVAAGGAQAEAEIFIYGDIGESWWAETVTAAQFVKDLAAISAERITVRINSFGGSVPDGLAIYNAMKRHKAHITTCNDGTAMSIASLILLGGDTVEMADNAILMVHAPWTYAAGNSVEMRRTADMLDQWASAMSGSYADKTGKTKDEVMALLTDGEDHYYTAAEALAQKFIDVVTNGLPVAASAGLDLSRFIQANRNVPAVLLARSNTVAPATPSQVAAATSTPVAQATQKPQEQHMTQPVTSPAAADQQAVAAATDAAVQAALAKDQARRDGISASFAKFSAQDGVADLLAQCQKDAGMTVEAAGLKLLAHIGKDVTPAAGHTVVHTVKDEADKHRDAMVNAVLARSAVVISKDGAVRVDASNPYRGYKLLDLARACLVRAGIKTDGMDQRALVAAAFTQTTSDFPVLLENVMHKTLQGAYAIQADTWSMFCARGSVSDFRAHNRYRSSSLGNLSVVNEAGEFPTDNIPDGEKDTITATTKGKIINITRQTVINDDLGAFTTLAAGMGRAAKRTVEADVYATLALNSGFGPTLSDGLSLFHATHNNVSTGAPLVASFEAARVVLSAQKDVGNNDFLALTPAVWLGPDAISGQARVVVNSTYDPDAANKLQRANIAAGIVQNIVGTPRLTGTPWYFFADPMVAPVLEVAFLDGIDTPYLEMENGFTVDGSSWKVRMDYGVAGRDYRGAVRSTGA